MKTIWQWLFGKRHRLSGDFYTPNQNNGCWEHLSRVFRADGVFNRKRRRIVKIGSYRVPLVYKVTDSGIRWEYWIDYYCSKKQSDYTVDRIDIHNE